MGLNLVKNLSIACLFAILVPKNLFNLVVDVVEACKNEEIVAQTVEVCQHVLVHIVLVGESHNAAFAAACHGAANLRTRRDAAATGKHKIAERWQFGVEQVYLMLDVGYIVFVMSHFLCAWSGLGGEIRSDVEEFVLNYA